MPTLRHEHERLTLVYALILAVVAALYRLAPYYLFDTPEGQAAVWNLMPVGALAVFVGSRLRTHYAFLLPLAVMLISDLLLIEPIHRLTGGKYSAMGWGRLVVYASFTVYVLIGRLVQAHELSPLVIGGGALLGGLQFFLITNFGVWLGNPLYPQTLSGLMSCYTVALPFF